MFSTEKSQQIKFTNATNKLTK